MSLNWKKLEITQAQLEELIDFDLLSTWAIDISRVFVMHKKTYRRSLLFTESCSLFLVYLLLCPVILILFRNLAWLSNNTRGLILVLISTGFISVFIIILLNYYLWHKAKKLKVFAVLLEKVKQYNSLINNLKLVTELKSLSSDVQNTSDSQAEIQLETVLTLTKNSLIKSIELEKIIDRDRSLINNRYQLLANLESGLVNLSSLSQDNSDNYQQLVSEVIEIGLSVHQEIRKTQTLKQSFPK